MTRDPVEGDNHFGMEVTYGACEAIVSGEVQGDLYLLNRATGDILSAETGTKTSVSGMSLSRIGKWTTKSNFRSLSKSGKSLPLLKKLIASIYDLGMLVERHFQNSTGY